MYACVRGIRVCVCMSVCMPAVCAYGCVDESVPRGEGVFLCMMMRKKIQKIQTDVYATNCGTLSVPDDTVRDFRPRGRIYSPRKITRTTLYIHIYIHVYICV